MEYKTIKSDIASEFESELNRLSSQDGWSVMSCGMSTVRNQYNHPHEVWWAILSRERK